MEKKGEMISKVSDLRALAFKMPCCLFCLKRNRNERIFSKTKKKLAKELDIVDFLKFIRETKAFMKSSVSLKYSQKFIKPQRIYYVNSADSNDNDIEMT